MILDVKTLFITLTVVSTFLNLALVFYWVDRKTYHGFGFWVVDTLLGAAGYCLLALRSWIPLGLSILGSNRLFSSAAVCKLDGVRRFLKDRALGKGYYLLPFMVTAASTWFYFGSDNIAIRIFTISLTVSACALSVAWHLIRYSPLA